MAQIRQQLRRGKLKMAIRYGAGGVPYIGDGGEQDEAPAAPEAAEEQPAPAVKVDVSEKETPGDIPKG